MPEHHDPVVADLDVIGIRVEPDGSALFDIQRLFAGPELTTVDPHALTSPTDRGQTSVLGLGDETVTQVKCRPLPRRHDATGHAVAWELDIGKGKLAQIIIARKVEHVLEPPKGEVLRTCGIIKLAAQCETLLPHIDITVMDFTPDSVPRDKAAHRNIGVLATFDWVRGAFTE